MIRVINLSFPRADTGSDSPHVPQASVEVTEGHIQPMCCHVELYPLVEEEGFSFCPGVEVFLEELPLEHLGGGFKKAREGILRRSTEPGKGRAV